MDENELLTLNNHVEGLIKAYQKLQQENAQLREQQQQLTNERNHLKRINHKAGEDVKRIIHRLKTVEETV